MAVKLKSYQKAGRLIRLLGWISLAMTLLVAFVKLIPAFNSGKPIFQIFLNIVLFVLLGLLCVFELKVGTAVKEHKNWGRTIGIIMGVISLPTFPIGTIIGGFIIYYIIKGWDE